jgi:DNA ligase-1
VEQSRYQALQQMISKPMKASDFEEESLCFPYLGSPKLDGYRAFSEGGVIRTSSGNVISNHHTRVLFSGFDFSGLDGELIVGHWADRNAFHNTSGPVRRATGMPEVKWYIFDDRTNPALPFEERLANAKTRVQDMKKYGNVNIEIVPHIMLNDRAALAQFERDALESGFEGVMLRDPAGPYKFGRSTVKENWLLKVKRFISEEATILALEEQVENTNASDVDNFGRAKKSTNKETQIGTGMVGAFVVSSDLWAEDFRISASSMTHKERQYAWQNQQEYVGELARFKYFPHGVVDVPRHGVFESIRGKEDL